MPAPDVSVIVPTFGRAAQVARAVASVLAQDADLEVVVVDDASPVPIAIDDKRVRVIRLAHNVGAAGARNAGVAAASSDWLAFLDSDDVWTPKSLGPRLELARAGDHIRTIWGAGFASIWPDGRSLVRIPRASSSLADMTSGCWICPGSTALLSRAAWERSGGQDEALRRQEDYDWLLRWGQSGGLIAVHEGVAAEITRGPRGAPADAIAAAEYIRRKNADLPAALKKRMESYLLLEIGVAELGARRMFAGANALLQSWLLHPRVQASLEPFWRPKIGG